MKPSNGLSQPPKKKTAVSAEISSMLAYSARKNSANAMPEYSTWKPATISDSPSATSNGARLVSATPEMKYTRNSGNSQNQFQREEAALLAAARCRPGSNYPPP